MSRRRGHFCCLAQMMAVAGGEKNAKNEERLSKEEEQQHLLTGHTGEGEPATKASSLFSAALPRYESTQRPFTT